MVSFPVMNLSNFYISYLDEADPRLARMAKVIIESKICFLKIRQIALFFILILVVENLVFYLWLSKEVVIFIIFTLNALVFL